MVLAGVALALGVLPLASDVVPVSIVTCDVPNGGVPTVTGGVIPGVNGVGVAAAVAVEAEVLGVKGGALEGDVDGVPTGVAIIVGAADGLSVVGCGVDGVLTVGIGCAVGGGVALGVG